MHMVFSDIDHRTLIKGVNGKTKPGKPFVVVTSSRTSTLTKPQPERTLITRSPPAEPPHSPGFDHAWGDPGKNHFTGRFSIVSSNGERLMAPFCGLRRPFLEERCPKLGGQIPQTLGGWILPLKKVFLVYLIYSFWGGFVVVSAISIGSS